MRVKHFQYEKRYKKKVLKFFLSEFSFTDTDNSQKCMGKEGPCFFFSATSTRLLTFSYLFATLHVRWLTLTFNCTDYIYQAATRWVLSTYWITILIDWWRNFSVCFLICWWFDFGFLLQCFFIGKWWIWTHIDYHPFISRKRTNKVYYPPPQEINS